MTVSVRVNCVTKRVILSKSFRESCLKIIGDEGLIPEKKKLHKQNKKKSRLALQCTWYLVLNWLLLSLCLNHFLRPLTQIGYEYKVVLISKVREKRETPKKHLLERKFHLQCLHPASRSFQPPSKVSNISERKREHFVSTLRSFVMDGLDKGVIQFHSYDNCSLNFQHPFASKIMLPC